MVYLLLAALAALGSCSATNKLPSSFKRCSVDDPKLDECMRVAVEGAFRSMKNGIPSLGLLPVDPLYVNEINIDQGETGPVRLAMHLKNISMSGLSHTSLTNYSANLDKLVLRTTSFTPTLAAQFTHNINGRVLLLPITGAGPGSFTVSDVYTDHTLKFSLLKKKGGRGYWKMEKYLVGLRPKSVKIDFMGLFSGDPRLGQQMRNFISENSNLVFQEMKGPLDEAFGAIFKEFTDRIFSKVPINDIFIYAKDSEKMTT